MRYVNVYDRFHNLVTRLAAADGTLAAERSHELLDTVLAPEVLDTIAGGQMHASLTNDKEVYGAG